MQSLSGWTVIGYGRVNLPLITLPWDEVRDRGSQALEVALSELSLYCDTKEAENALYLVSAPEEEMNIDLVKHIGERIRSIAPKATINYGDYPFNKGLIDVTLIFSGLKEVEKVTDYYVRSTSITQNMKAKQEDAIAMTSSTDEAEKYVQPLGQ